MKLNYPEEGLGLLVFYQVLSILVSLFLLSFSFSPMGTFLLGPSTISTTRRIWSFGFCLSFFLGRAAGVGGESALGGFCLTTTRTCTCTKPPPPPPLPPTFFSLGKKVVRWRFYQIIRILIPSHLALLAPYLAPLPESLGPGLIGFKGDPLSRPQVPSLPRSSAHPARWRGCAGGDGKYLNI